MMSASAQNEKKGNTSKGKNKQVLTVKPLNSAPYLGPSSCYTSSMSANKSTDNAEKVGLPPAELRQDFNDFVAQTQTGVTLTGSAGSGQIGPTLGLVDIAESDDSYFFRVSLPGVSRDKKEFTCDIETDGRVVIEGVTTTGEKTVCKDSQVFKMLTQNLCPPGHFTIEFQLPGPVKNEDFTGTFEPGVLEGVVKKLNENCESVLEDTFSLEFKSMHV